MALIDERGPVSAASCPAWFSRISDVTLRRLVVGGCALCWVTLGLVVFG